MKNEILSSWNEMSQSRRSLGAKVEEQDADIQTLKRGLEQLQNQLKTKDAKISGKVDRC